jgi:hypothetical protein
MESEPVVMRCRERLAAGETVTLLGELRRREPELFFDGRIRTCSWCERYAGGVGRPCPGCAARGRRLRALVDRQGVELAGAARTLMLDPATAATLLERARYSVDAPITRVKYVPNVFVRELYQEACRRDPETSPDRLAQIAGYSDGTHVARLLGLRPTSSRRHGEKSYPGHVLTTMSVENAARIVRALGRDPVEFRELGL